MNLNNNNYAKLKSNLQHDQKYYEANYQFVNINLNMKILYILAKKQRNNGSHVSHTKKIDHVHKKGSSFYKISNHCYINAKPLGNKGQIRRVHEREPQGPRVA